MQALLVLEVVAGICELGVPLHDPDGFVQRVQSLIERAWDAEAEDFGVELTPELRAQEERIAAEVARQRKS